LTYYVYRDTVPGVSATPEKIVASGLGGTSFVDSGGLVDGLAYYYLVRALDRSTSQFDSNVVESAGTPTGPGTGISSFFFENFTNPSVLAEWVSDVSPGSRSCGLWERTGDAQLKPAGGAGFFVTSNGSVCGNQKTATSFESPSIDIGLSGVQKVTLTLDVFYSFLGDSDSATIEGWDGATWQIIWTSPAASVNTELSFDVTTIAGGNPDFRIRFVYDDIDQWFSVDNVDVTVDVVKICATRFGPSPVPDGRGAGAPIRGDRLSVSGDQIQLTWDAASCTATEYSLLYGDLSSVSNYTLSGSECSLGTTGSFDWNGVPAGDLFFLLVGTDGSRTESSWGTDSLFGERNGLGPSGTCGTTGKDVSGSCP
jgi:hypothetical protein